MIYVPWLMRLICLSGFFGLVVLIIGWNGFLSTEQYMPRWLEIGLLLAPLLSIAKGLMQNQGKAYVLSVLLSLIYATIGFLMAGSEPLYGYAMIGCSVLLYIGGFLCARVISKRNKALEQAKTAPQPVLAQEAKA